MAGKTQRETLRWAVEMLCWVVIHHAVWRVSRQTLLVWDFLLKPMCLVGARCASSFWMPLLAWCFAWRCFRGAGAVGNDRSWGGARGHRGLLIHHGSRETRCTPSCHGCESVGRQWDAVFFTLSLLSAGVTQANCRAPPGPLTLHPPRVMMACLLLQLEVCKSRDTLMLTDLKPSLQDCSSSSPFWILNLKWNKV